MSGGGGSNVVLIGAAAVGIVSVAQRGLDPQALALAAFGALGALLAVAAVVLGRRFRLSRGATASEAAAAASVEWDYVIVGGGTAGCVLANRLSAAGGPGEGKKVLVLEAGRADYDASLVRIPAGVLRLFRSKYDWDFNTSNEEATAGRSIYLCRGKVLGGSSSLNVLLYQRGSAADYNSWETEFGCKGWNAGDVLPHFKRTEDDLTGQAAKDPKHHGCGGEWAVDHVRYQNPLSKKFLKACEEFGLPLNSDFNNWDQSQEGAGRFPVSERNGTRCSAASALLEPALADPGRRLRVLTMAPARRVIFGEGSSPGRPRAAGVQFAAGGEEHIVRLAKGGEVLLTGGALHSPQLLMLSGIGPAGHLKEHGIEVVKDVPAVGMNLQDHPAAVVSFECPSSQSGVSVTSKLRVAGTALPHPGPLLEWALRGDGPLTSTGCDHGGFFRTAAAPGGSRSADLQMRFLAARAISADGMGTFTKFQHTTHHPDGFSFQSIAVRPQSRGRVLLSSADPEEKPLVEGKYLTDKADVASIREGLKMSRKLAAQPAFKEYLGPEVFPGPEVQSDAELDEYIAETVHTANALVGTCRMGQESDPLTVCDPEMRVKGVDSLRVCDASLAPRIPGGQTGAMVVMMAERAAEMILGIKGKIA